LTLLPGQKRLDALRASHGASDGSRSEDQEIPQQIKGDWILVNIEVEGLTKTLQLATVTKGLVLHFVKSQDPLARPYEAHFGVKRALIGPI
jgi:hypothetical protein